MAPPAPDGPTVTLEVAERASPASSAGSAERPKGLRRTAVSAGVFLFLTYLGIGMYGPPAQTLFLLRACEENGLPPDQCVERVHGAAAENYHKAQKQAAGWVGLSTLAGGASQLMTCTLLGSVGDTWGRRVPLLINPIGGILTNFAMWALPASRQGDLFMALLFVFGLSGGMYAANHAAFAAVADVTQRASPVVRSRAFGAVEGVLWLGLLVGPFLSGLLAKWVGVQNVFLVIGGIGVVNLAIVLLTYHETLEAGRRRPFSWRRANPIANLAMLLETRTTGLLGAMTFCALAAHNGVFSVLPLHAERVAGMSTLGVGALMSVSFGASFVGLALVLPVLLRCSSLTANLRLSLAGTVACFCLFSLCATRAQLFLTSASMLFSALFFPIVRTGVSNSFGSRRYGESLAAVGCVEQLAFLLGPPALTAVYRVTEDSAVHVGGVRVACASFLVAAAVASLGLLAAAAVQGIPKAEDAGASGAGGDEEDEEEAPQQSLSMPRLDAAC